MREKEALHTGGSTSRVREESTVIERPRPRPRVPCIAAVLGFLVPGLGHFYAGRPRQGALWYVAASAFPLVLAMSQLQFSFQGLLLFIALELSVAALVMIHGAKVASRQGAVILASWQRWWVYGLIVLLTFAFGTVMQFTVERKALGIRVFKIPSESMEPTLLVGDHIVVNIRAFTSSPPERGDIVVFRHPKQPDMFFVKRVAAVGGDTVALKGNRLYVNGKPVDEPYLSAGGDNSGIKGKAFGPVTVERGKIFVLGDNRDNSSDSRQWGALDMDALVGKAFYIYWSWDAPQKAPRTGRMGMEIN